MAQLEPFRKTRMVTSLGSTTTPDMTSLATSGWQLSKLQNGRKCRLRRLRCYISREPFELESPNFTSTSIPTCPTVASDATSLTTSGRKLPRKKRRKCRIRRLQVEFLDKGLSDDHQISQVCLGQMAPQTSRI